MWSPSRLARVRVAKRRTGTGAAINMWPFASVMAAILFLLIGDPSPRHPIIAPVDLPQSVYAASQPKAQSDDAILVRVARDGRIFFGNVRVGPEDLPEQIREAVERGAEPKVYLAGDARAKYGDIQAVVAKIREAGITDVVILAEKSLPR